MWVDDVVKEPGLGGGGGLNGGLWAVFEALAHVLIVVVVVHLFRRFTLCL